MFVQNLNILAFFGRYSLPMFAAHTFLIYFVNDIRFAVTNTFYTVAADLPYFQTIYMTIAVCIGMVIIAFLYQKLWSVFTFLHSQFILQPFVETAASNISYSTVSNEEANLNQHSQEEFNS